MNNHNAPNIATLKSQLVQLISGIGKYRVAIFLLFIVLTYGFVWLKITDYSNSQPSSQQVNNLVQAASIPHIDPTVLKQIQSLQDNSVNVQALFNQARSNPFSN